MARSTARKRALNTLYEADEKGQDILSLLAERLAQPGAQTPLPEYAVEIIRGVCDHRGQIDRALDTHSTGWKVRRMAVVDRNILRIAAWEILFNDEVPDKVAIDEALSLAKTLSDGDSPSFIHGLLSAVSADKQELLRAPEPDSAQRTTVPDRDPAQEAAAGSEGEVPEKTDAVPDDSNAAVQTGAADTDSDAGDRDAHEDGDRDVSDAVGSGGPIDVTQDACADESDVTQDANASGDDPHPDPSDGGPGGESGDAPTPGHQQ
jgi:N utilization substance protein B